MTSVAETLNLTADHIQEHGWWSKIHGSVDAGGGVTIPWCASNGISAVAGGANAGMSARRAFAVYLGGTGCHDIYDWNDAPERTAAEVIEVLRAAAVIEAAKEAAPVEVTA